MNHVLFSLWYVQPETSLNFSASQAIDWGWCNNVTQPPCPTALAGQPQVGAWIVDDGIPQALYAGCMTPLATPGARQCPNAGSCSPSNPCTWIFNDWPSEQIPVARHPDAQAEDLFLRDEFK